MPAAVRLGVDNCSGHNDFPPRPATSGSPNVHKNGIPVVRVTDTWASHCGSRSCHDSQQETGSPNVHANGLPVARVGDKIACGSTCAHGSPNCFVNG